MKYIAVESSRSILQWNHHEPQNAYVTGNVDAVVMHVRTHECGIVF